MKWEVFPWFDLRYFKLTELAGETVTDFAQTHAPLAGGAAPERLIFLRSLGLSLLLTPVLAALFVAMLTAVLTLPDERIAANIERDSELLQHPRLYSFAGRKIDVGTECIGVSFGLGDEARTSTFEAALRAPVIFDCPSLLGYVRGGESGAAGDYSYYWHGYAVISRPLLALGPYRDIRMLTFNVMAALVAFLALALVRRAGPRFAFAVLLPFYFINYSGFFELWTKAAGWIVMLIAANIIVRTKWSVDRKPYLLFYFMGAATAYVDLLTTPLLVFGFPALLYLLIAVASERLDAKAQTLRLAAIGGFWTLGYAGLWIAKIVLAATVLGPEIWTTAAKAAAFRLNGDYESVKHFLGAGTLENFEAFKAFWGALVAVVFFVIPLARRDMRNWLVALARQAPVVVLIAVSPLVWYEIFSNHSQIHGLFTHANLALTLIPFSIALLRAPLPTRDIRGGDKQRRAKQKFHI